jgi:hypothetical protein
VRRAPGASYWFMEAQIIMFSFTFSPKVRGLLCQTAKSTRPRQKSIHLQHLEAAYKGVTNPCNSTALRVGRQGMAWRGAWRGCPTAAPVCAGSTAGCAGGTIRQEILSRSHSGVQSLQAARLPRSWHRSWPEAAAVCRPSCTTANLHPPASRLCNPKSPLPGVTSAVYVRVCVQRDAVFVCVWLGQQGGLLAGK